MLSPEAFAQFPIGIPLPAVFCVLIIGREPCADTFRIDQFFASLVGTEATKLIGVDFQRSARSSKHCLPGGWHGPFPQLLLRWEDSKVLPADVTSVRFIEAFPSDHTFIFQVPNFVYPLGHVFAHCQVVSLQVFLNILAVDDGIRGEIFSSEEEGEDGLAS